LKTRSTSGSLRGTHSLRMRALVAQTYRKQISISGIDARIVALSLYGDIMANSGRWAKMISAA